MSEYGSSLGFGLGLRQPHIAEILRGGSKADWLEAITENYLGLPGYGLGPAPDNLMKIRELKPVVLHGVSLSLGSNDPLNSDYLRAAKDLFEKIQPAWVSDHLCWTGVHGRNSHDLLPLPYTQETIQHLVSRIQKVQDAWKRQILIENVSSYVEFQANEMSEWEFLREIVERSGCGLLLDVNNIYVSSRNHKFNANTYLECIPWNAVRQFHLAGHLDEGDMVLDTHDHPVRKEVWNLYALAVQKAPLAATMIEWDENIPPLPELEAELHKAKEIHAANTAAYSRKIL